MNASVMRFPTQPCWLCGLQGAYTCPCCTAVSCSLSCYRTHKEVAECSGDWRDAEYERNSEIQHQRDLQQLLEAENHKENLNLRANCLLNPNRITTRSYQGSANPFDLVLQQARIPISLKVFQREVRREFGSVVLFSNVSHVRSLSSYDKATNKFLFHCTATRLDFTIQLRRNLEIYLIRYFEYLHRMGIYDIKKVRKQPFDIVFDLYTDEGNRMDVFLVHDEPAAQKAKEQWDGPECQVLYKLDLVANRYVDFKEDMKLETLLRQGLVIVDHIKLYLVSGIPTDVNAVKQNEQLVNMVHRVSAKFQAQQITYVADKMVQFLVSKYQRQIAADIGDVPEWAAYDLHKGGPQGEGPS